MPSKKLLKREGFHVINGKQTDIPFHKEDMDPKSDKQFRDAINKLYRKR